MRLKNNLTQQQVADKLNISRTAVGKWETENAYPDVEKLIALANIYNCSVDYLLALSDNTRVLTHNELATLEKVISIALKENIITDRRNITAEEFKNLAEEIETAYIASVLFKRINNDKK